MPLPQIRRFFLLLLFASFPSWAGSTPIHPGSTIPYPELEASADPLLQSALERGIESLSLAEPARSGRLSTALADITDPRRPRFAAVNPDKMAYAASLPKIAILLGAFSRIEEGDMRLDASTRDSLERMIRFSSNQAASEMLERVGTRYLAERLQSPRYRLYDPRNNGGLWVGRPYGKGGETLRDPLRGLSHAATALQVARFYYLLETGRLVSPESSAEMKTILGNPGIPHKFVRGLETRRPGSRLYRKSGSWRDWHSDSAIVERDGRRYIAVALAEDPLGGEWMERLIVSMDEAVFSTAPGEPRQPSLVGQGPDRLSLSGQNEAR